MLRVVHASPGAPPVDVYITGQSGPVFQTLRYGETTRYRAIDAGDHSIELRSAGSASPLLVSDARSFRDDEHYTAVIAGLANTTSPAGRLRVLHYEEEFTDPGDREARVRFINASPDAPTVTIRVRDGDDETIDRLGRFEASPADGVDLDAGERLRVDVVAPDTDQIIATFTLAELPPSTTWYGILTGLANAPPGSPDGLTLLTVGPVGSAPRPVVLPEPAVYLMHGSPDATSLDIYEGGVLVANNVAFGNLVGPIRLGPGPHTLDVFTHMEMARRPEGLALASIRTADLRPGQQYLGVIAGYVTPRANQPPLQVLTFGTQFGPVTQAPLLRVINALAGAPPLQVGQVQANTFVSPLAYGSVAFSTATDATGQPLPLGTVLLGLAPVGSVAPVATFAVEVSPSMHAFLVPIGSMGPATGEKPIRMVVVNTSVWPWTARLLEPQ